MPSAHTRTRTHKHNLPVPLHHELVEGLTLGGVAAARAPRSEQAVHLVKEDHTGRHLARKREHSLDGVRVCVRVYVCVCVCVARAHVNVCVYVFAVCVGGCRV